MGCSWGRGSWGRVGKEKGRLPNPPNPGNFVSFNKLLIPKCDDNAVVASLGVLGMEEGCGGGN